MRLTDYIGDEFITINDQRYDIDLSFDNVLRSYELAKDDSVDSLAVIDIMFNNLVVDCDQEIDFEEKRDIVDFIFNNIIAKDDIREKEKTDEEETEEDQKTEQKTHDFVKDAEFIYASFLYDYKIDLFDMQGRLHWSKFVALLNNLSDDSPFKKVVHIRVKKIPKQTKHNKEEIANLKRLKRFYSLDDETTPEERIDSALTTLGSAFMGAKKGGNK